jgi:hypothetical protein
MRVLVDSGRFLSLPCDSEEYLVFDRKEGKHHLLRESAARLWHQIQEGGRFELEGAEEGADPVALLSEAGLVEVVKEFTEAPVSHISRREWIGRTPRIAPGGGGHRGDSPAEQRIPGPSSADLCQT